jgi:hypothetical protein
MGLVVKSKVVTVATHGTAVPILAAGDAQSDIVGCIIQAQTNTIYVGDSTVSNSTPIGHKLVSSTNDVLRLTDDFKNGIDLAKVYLDASADGSKANVTYWVRV